MSKDTAEKDADKKYLHRVTAVVNDSDYDRIKRAAEAKDMSVNDYVRYSVDLAMRFDSRMIPASSLIDARVNQIIEVVTALQQDVNNSIHSQASFQDTMLSLMRGKNYLLDDSDDEG